MKAKAPAKKTKKPGDVVHLERQGGTDEGLPWCGEENPEYSSSKPGDANCADCKKSSAKAVCVVAMCAQAAVTRGVCKTHYSKAKRLKLNLDGLSAQDLQTLSADARQQRRFAKPPASKRDQVPSEEVVS
jgi:hypothetical protein